MDHQIGKTRLRFKVDPQGVLMEEDVAMVAWVFSMQMQTFNYLATAQNELAQTKPTPSKMEFQGMTNGIGSTLTFKATY